MTTAVQNDPNDPRPFGAQQKRSRAPLMISLVLYLIWLAFLILLASFYPARG